VFSLSCQKEGPEVNLRSLRATSCCTALLLASLPVQAQQPADQKSGATFEPNFPALNNNYPLTPDSIRHPDVPRGIELKLEISDSKVYPSTKRTISVYVPAAYKADKPACVFVFFDGIAYNAPAVFDNLIAAHQMPVTIAIGIPPAPVPTADNAKPPRYDRSFEFDNRTDRLARFVLDEVLPAVQTLKTPDGRAILLSSNPDDRAIAGNSTGGIAAFNVAWQRPDAFHRVFTNIGTFVGMRGGEQFYVQVRKTEPKPLRVFMVDGANDGWGGGLQMGDWWMANLTMERALAFAGYDINHAWGAGNHNGNLAAQVFPNAVRWLFRDYPSAIVTPTPLSQALKPILIPGESWKLLPSACAVGSPLAANAEGVVSTPDSSGGVVPLSDCTSTTRVTAFAIAPGNKTYVAASGKQGIEASNSAQTLAPDLNVTAIAARVNGDVYLASKQPNNTAELWLLHPDGTKLKLADTPHTVSALAFTPDGNWLFVAQPDSHLSYSFRVQLNGTLDSGEPFYDLYTPAASDGSHATAVAMDREGRAYVATALGVQVMDHNGRVVAILPLPTNQPADSLCFGGTDFTTLYVSSGGKLYTRKLKIGGLFPASTPISIPDWGGG
jgi:gluconolactonase